MTLRTSSARESDVVPADAPAIRGLRFRRLRGEGDYPALVEILNRGRAADGMDQVTTVEELTQRFRHLVNCDLDRDLLLAEVRGQVVGFVRVAWYDVARSGRGYMHWGGVLPAWRRRGIGRALLGFAECRLGEIASQHPPGPTAFFQVFAGDSEVGALALYQLAGYAPVRRSFLMVRPGLEHIPANPLPPGLEVRPTRPEHYRVVYAANEEAFSDHWGYVARTETDYQRWLGEPSFQPDLWQVAWEGDQVAGMVLNYIHFEENAAHGRLRGYTEDICVRKPWRRRGLARALIGRSLMLLRARGMQEAALGVDSQNESGALRLYEGLGYRPERSYTVFRKPLDGG